MSDNTEKESIITKAGYVAILAVKSSKLIAALKSVTAFKPFVSLLTAFGSVFAYSFLLGWEFAAGFVGMLFIHELGHVGAAKRRGFKTSAPVFIPFVGALITMRDMGNRDDEAYVGIGGPLVGGLAALVLLIPTIALPHPPAVLVGLCYTSLFLNLFNLIPVRPLDGGRVLQATGKVSRFLAGIAVIAIPFLFRVTFLLFIWIIALGHLKIPTRLRLALGLLIQGVMLVLGINHVWNTNLLELILGQVYASFVNWINSSGGFSHDSEDKRPQLQRKRQWVWAGCYIGLAVALGGAMLVIHQSFLPPSAK